MKQNDSTQRIEDLLQLESILLAGRDEKNAAFESRLVPELDPSRILGWKMPALRQLKKQLSSPLRETLLSMPRHPWFEEDLLHLLLVDDLKDASSWKQALDLFGDSMMSWMHTDCLSFRKLPVQEALELSTVLLQDKRVYLRRAGILLLMKRGIRALDREALQGRIEVIVQMDLSERPLMLAASWMLSEVGIRDLDHLLFWLQSKRLPRSVQQMTISKCMDSRRYSVAEKAQIRAFRPSRISRGQGALL